MPAQYLAKPMTVDHLQVVTEQYVRLVREAERVVRAAELDEQGRAVVPVATLNRLSRELKGERQTASWMSRT